MLIKLLIKVFGSCNDCILRWMCKVVNIINVMELEMEKFFDEELKGKIVEFCVCLEKGEVLENLILEVFVVVCEVSKCVFGMCYFDVQLFGGMVFNECCIVEMCIGEGKILIVMLFVYLNVLIGKGVYVVIVNDYLV